MRINAKSRGGRHYLSASQIDFDVTIKNEPASDKKPSDHPTAARIPLAK